MLDPATIATVAKVLGLNTKQIFSALKNAHKYSSDLQTQEATTAFIQGGLKITDDGSSNRLLSHYYPASKLRDVGLMPYNFSIGDRQFPTTIATCRQWIHCIQLNSDFEKCRLTSANPAPLSITEETAAQLLTSWSLRNIRVWDAPVYRLLDLQLADECLRADFSLDSFVRYRMTNGALADELVQALIDTDFDVEDVLANADEHLPLRRILLPDSGVFAKFKSRLCTGGVNVVTAIARPEPYHDYGIILQRRSASVSTRQSGLTILPAGHHQPTVQPEKEVPISCTVFRELFEELFGGEEISNRSQHLLHDWFYHETPIKWLMEHKGAYDLTLTGFGISMLSGSYTFSVLLAIHDQSFWGEFGPRLRTNWEIGDIHEPILSTKSSSVDVFSKNQWTDYGIFALVEGLLQLMRIKPHLVSIPGLRRVVA